MLQRFDLCLDHTTAKLLLMYETDGQSKIVQVHPFGEHLGQSVTPEVLVRAPIHDDTEDRQGSESRLKTDTYISI